MSIRLNVIYSSPLGTSAAHQAHEEALITQLISQPGLDLNLIGPLENLSQSATDLLLLDGFKGDLAVIAWSAPEQSAHWLRQSGLTGARTPHRLDPDSQHAEPQSESASRKWYLIDLRNTQPSEVLEGLRGILQARRTPTVSLSLSPTAPLNPNPKTDTTPPRQTATQQDSTQTAVATPHTETNSPDQHSAATPDSMSPKQSPASIASELERNSQKANPSTSAPRTQHKSKDELDSLMDDLDAWDAL